VNNGVVDLKEKILNEKEGEKVFRCQHLKLEKKLPTI